MPMRGKSLALLALLAAALVVPGGTRSADAEPGVAVATDQIMAGLYAPQQWFSREHIFEVNQASGKNVSIGGIWVDITEPPGNVTYMLEEIWSVGATPFVNIHFAGTPTDVSAGTFDSHISSLAASIDRWLSMGGNRMVMLAPMPEMNGNWIPYGMDPVGFRKAFRHIVWQSSKSGSTGWNVRWVFAPNGWSAPPHRMVDYYPGADVVDLVGMSAYNWGTSELGTQWTTVQATMGGALDEARGFAPEKPFLISQTASSSFGGDKEAWIREMFSYLAADPNAVGFIYFNIHKEQDWSINRGRTEVNQGWLDGMSLDTTVYQWPLVDWVNDGLLTVDNYHVVFEGRFSDDDRSPFVAEIEWLASSGITQGCDPQRFCPGEPVTRGQMASFLSRALALPVGSPDFFSDDAGSPHEEAINAIRAAGLTSGCAPTEFCPHASTTREQMATFLARSLGLPGSPTDFFTDDIGSIHEGDINALRDSEITLGCSETTFCPTTKVSREQMAAFLFRSFSSP